MRALRRYLAFAVLLCLVPTPARAVLASSCGGSFDKTNQCEFVATGQSFLVEGSSPNGSMQVVITIAGTIGVLGCYSDSRPSHCIAGAGFGDVSPIYVDAPIGAPLTCSVYGTTTGTFRCANHTF